MSIDLVTPWLACPICEGGMQRIQQSLRCRRGHCFDIAKQGYVNLLGRAAPKNADTPAMLAARSSFLARGHYRPIADALSRRLTGSLRLVEVGAGTGYYLASVLQTVTAATGLATDVSPAACRIAARAHPQIAAVVADTWAGLPLRQACADAIICAFAPRNPKEFWRVLRPGGMVLVVTPGSDHLQELRRRFGLLAVAEGKSEALRHDLAAFSPIACLTLEWTMTLPPQAVTEVVSMGPNAFHQDVAALTADLDDAVQATGSVKVWIYRRPEAAV